MALRATLWFLRPSRPAKILGFRALSSGGADNDTYSFSQKKSRLVNLWDEYKREKQAVDVLTEPGNQDPQAVYANNELDLKEIDVFGFDYDYTIASYKAPLHYLIFYLGRDALVKDHKYPEELNKLEYDPKFAVRGLHCDISKGLLLKIDAFHNIQMGTVYRGKQPVSAEEVHKLYDGSHVGIDQMSSFHGRLLKGKNMVQLMDMFALPEMTLYANVLEYFNQRNITYDPEYVFHDVTSTVQKLHHNGVIHQEIQSNMGVFLDRTMEREFLVRLQSAGKKLFLITNNSIQFVSRGMQFIVGDDWQSFFDVIITNARKPKFFYDSTRPFRKYDLDLEIKSWDRVNCLQKNHIYNEGNVVSFRELTGWFGGRVLYFGDHVYSDLADAALKHGWRTGAIIPELEGEVEIINSIKYRETLKWLIALENLIKRMQIYEDADSRHTLNEWLAERKQLREQVKEVFNPRFGSVFRTYQNPTYFSRRLIRFADVYMSSLVNLMNYPLDYTFYPVRSALPHEKDGAHK